MSAVAADKAGATLATATGADARVRNLAAQLALVAEGPNRGPGDGARRQRPASGPPAGIGSALVDEFRAAWRAVETPEEADDVLEVFEHRLRVARRGLRRVGPAPAAAVRVEARRRHRRRLLYERAIREDPVLADLVAERERQAFADGLLTAREEADETFEEADESATPDARQGELARAVEVVADALRDGARPASEVYALTDAAGISRRTTRRARDELGVVAGRGRGALWSLPG